METFSNNLLVNTIYYLLNFEKYQNFQDAVRQAAINNNFQLVLLSDDFNTIFSVETRHSTSIESAVRAKIDSQGAAQDQGARVDVNGIVTYWGTVNVSGEHYYLMLVDNDQNYSQDDIKKLAEIIELAMGMWNYVPNRDITAELIRAVRRGNRALAHTLLEELNISERELKGVFVIPGARKEESINRFAAFEEKYKLRLLKVFEAEEVAGIILESSDALLCKYDEWNDFSKELYPLGATKLFWIEDTDGVEGLCNAFNLINETDAFAQIIFPKKRLFSKYELTFIGNCVSICIAGGSNKRNYLDLVKAFRKTPDKKTKELEDTLAVFVLDAGLSAAKAAKIMDIHANTVQYRLKRIREVLGLDIMANTIVPSLMMAMAISRVDRGAGQF